MRTLLIDVDSVLQERNAVKRQGHETAQINDMVIAMFDEDGYRPMPHDIPGGVTDGD